MAQLLRTGLTHDRITNCHCFSYQEFTFRTLYGGDCEYLLLYLILYHERLLILMGVSFLCCDTLSIMVLIVVILMIVTVTVIMVLTSITVVAICKSNNANSSNDSNDDNIDNDNSNDCSNNDYCSNNN